MDENQQTVAPEPGSEATPSEQPKGAQDDDLDKYLAEFDEGNQEEEKTEPKRSPSTKKDDAPVTRSEVDRLWEELSRKDTKAAMKSLSEDLRGDLDAKTFDDDLVIGWAERRAQNDPRILRAWQSRESNPKAWAKVAQALAKDFQGKFRDAPDRQATEDRAAVSAAARSASTRASEDFPTEKEVARMSDAEFFQLKQKILRG